jgi:UDP-N-acetylmuramoyl-L-alanyl-D-glutamate--2,6-diaminopimelate ligase
MRLAQVAKIVGVRKRAFPDYTIIGISSNSKDVSCGFVFVAIKGPCQDGHAFIPDAINRGARVVVTSGVYPQRKEYKDVVFFSVRDTRRALAALADHFYGRPSRALKVVGVTGTNGKTTVTYLLEAFVKGCTLKPAVIGTVNYRYNRTVLEAKNTTPGVVQIQSLLGAMRSADVAYVFMEVSSHALDQGRVEGVRFHSAIFTNLTQDHLDYHKTMEDYFLAKAKLFSSLNRRAFAVVNNDDRLAPRLKKVTRAAVITYGINTRGDVSATDICYHMDKTEFTVTAGRKAARIKTRLVGRHNVYNVLACIAWGIKAGFSLSSMQRIIAGFAQVPGRLERIDTKSGFVVYVDYAHTDDALRNVLSALRQVAQGRIIVVFGCGGDRDTGKRPKMGKVATSLADYVIITSDNPRSENPHRIIDAITRGIATTNFRVVRDRGKAIKQALTLAKNGDIVLVAGKGHENYQIIKGKVTAFDDRQVVRQCLQSLKL